MIEYLVQSYNPAVPEDYRPKFTSDVAAAEVSLADSGLVANDGLLRNGAGLFLFQPDDNMEIISAGITFPHGFILGSRPVLVKFRIETAANVLVSTADLTLPGENIEYEVNNFSGYPSSGNQIKLRAVFAGLNAAVVPFVSMANCPAVLGATVFRAWFYAKIAHNLPLV